MNLSNLVIHLSSLHLSIHCRNSLHVVIWCLMRPIRSAAHCLMCCCNCEIFPCSCCGVVAVCLSFQQFVTIWVNSGILNQKFSHLKNLVFLKSVFAVNSKGLWSDEVLAIFFCIEFGYLLFHSGDIKNLSSRARCGDWRSLDHVYRLPVRLMFSNPNSDMSDAKERVCLQVF